MDVATQLRPLQHGTPCEIQAKKRAKTTAHDMVMQPDADREVDSSPNGSDSEASSSSQTASTVNAGDVDTDLEELQDQYYSSLREFSDTMEQGRPANRHCTPQELFAQEWDFKGGRDGLQRFLSLPPTWPLARLMFPIRNLKKQMETLLQAYCFETAVTCGNAEARAPSLNEWPCIWDNTWPYILLKLSQDSFSPSERTGQRNKCCITHSEVLGAGHIHRAFVCFQPVPSSSGKGTAEATQWAGKGWRVTPATRLFLAVIIGGQAPSLSRISEFVGQH